MKLNAELEDRVAKRTAQLQARQQGAGGILLFGFPRPAGAAARHRRLRAHRARGLRRQAGRRGPAPARRHRRQHPQNGPIDRRPAGLFAPEPPADGFRARSTWPPWPEPFSRDLKSPEKGRHIEFKVGDRSPLPAATAPCCARSCRTFWPTPSNSPAPAPGPASNSAAGGETEKRSIASRTTASASTWSTSTSSSACSSACTAATSSKAPASGWPSSSASSCATAGASGPRAGQGRRRLFISPCRPRPGTGPAVFAAKAAK